MHIQFHRTPSSTVVPSRTTPIGAASVPDNFIKLIHGTHHLSQRRYMPRILENTATALLDMSNTSPPFHATKSLCSGDTLTPNNLSKFDEAIINARSLPIRPFDSRAAYKYTHMSAPSPHDHDSGSHSPMQGQISHSGHHTHWHSQYLPSHYSQTGSLMACRS